jgi:hypothetical protein
MEAREIPERERAVDADIWISLVVLFTMEPS